MGEYKNVLVLGMAKSGIAATKLLLSKGIQTSISDFKRLEDIKLLADEYDMLSSCYCTYFDNALFDSSEFDLVVLSPGVNPDLRSLDNARKNNVEIISEVELGYRFSKAKFYGITGTNGKTTTTTIVGEIFKKAFNDVRVVGNIGTPLCDEVLKGDSEDTIYICELSSYQLECSYTFKLEFAAILNITPDHLIRHITMENYIVAKLMIYENLESYSRLLLNFNDKILREIGEELGGVTWFSISDETCKCFLKNGMMCLRRGEEVVEVLHRDEMTIMGDHNVENALVAIAFAEFCNIDLNIVREVLREFKGVEHRNQFVAKVNGIKYYNDSKATNPEASIPAIKSMKTPTVLIAGGSDKGSYYGYWVKSFQNIKYVVLIGETKFDIASEFEKQGFDKFTFAENMNHALDIAENIVVPGEAILLSPACASFDLYENYEQRGYHFCDLVKSRETNEA